MKREVCVCLKITKIWLLYELTIGKSKSHSLQGLDYYPDHQRIAELVRDGGKSQRTESAAPRSSHRRTRGSLHADNDAAANRQVTVRFPPLACLVSLPNSFAIATKLP